MDLLILVKSIYNNLKHIFSSWGHKIKLVDKEGNLIFKSDKN